jgi:transglutaminase-like putative cysteine protease
MAKYRCFKNAFFYVFLFILYSKNVFGADIKSEYSVSLIPDSLKKEAYMVVRSEVTNYIYKSLTSGEQSKIEVLTILDKKGDDMALFYYPGDKFRELKAFTAKLYDANGVLLKKYGMSDVQTTEWTDSYTLADGAKRYVFDFDKPTYPVTIEYNYTIGFKNGILSFPVFMPQPGYNTAVQKAVYNLTLPDNCKYQYKVFNMPAQPEKIQAKETSILKWEINNIKAVEKERFMDSPEKYIPILYIRPVSFSYDNVPGEISSWETMAKWESGLVKNRDQLPEEFKQKIRDIVKDAKTDRDKVKLLYDYLGKNTRYVSIQLGIGGYQPMQAADVLKTGYGDCKALTNYLKTLLAVVGINSNYTFITLDEDEKYLYSDFAGFNQLNHAILQVPLQSETLWLECTNPDVPFGFVHQGIAGHDALVVTADGGNIQRLPDYPDSLNVESFKSVVELAADGSARVQSVATYMIKAYDDQRSFVYIKPAEQKDKVRGMINVPSANVENVNFTENKSSLPSLQISFGWTAPQYGTKTGNRLFIPVNPLRSKGYDGLKKNSRIHDICINTGYKDQDSISIIIPEGYEIESMPGNVSLDNSFGSFKTSLTQNNSTIIVRHHLIIKSGKWSKNQYAELVAFFEKINSSYKAKIILRKKQI